MKKVFFLPILAFSLLPTVKTNAQPDTQTNSALTVASSSQVHELADKEARLSADYLTQKYEVDKTIQNSLYFLFRSKHLQIDETYKKYKGTDKLDKELTSVIAHFDSLQNSLLHMAEGNLFFKNRIETLNNIKPLDKNATDKLMALYRQACFRKNKNSLADIFNEVMRRVVRDTTYYAALYKEEINYQANIGGKRAAYNIFRDYKLTKEGYDLIYPIVYEKERALATINYALPVYNYYKDSVSNKATRYYDSLISLALMRDGNFTNISQFSIAVKNRKKLELRTGQVDTLLDKAVTLDRTRKEYLLKNPSGKFEGSPFEAQFITAILSEDQYLGLLAIKNKPQAEEWATGDWAELKQRGMTEGLDSLTVVYHITKYNTNRLVVKDRYANDKVKQNAQIKSIDETMPSALRRLKNARNADNVNANKSNAIPAVKASFQW